MSEPMYVQSAHFRQPDVWETASCNGCSRGEPIVAVLNLGKSTPSGKYQPSGFEWRMCQTCRDEFVEVVEAGEPTAWSTDPERSPVNADTLGPCGCVDYHMADCPLVTDRHGPLDPPEPDDD